MVQFDCFELPNGLKVLVNEDRSTPLVAINILYKVGSRNENPEKTGFAHLFEHLMFGGSINIPSFDDPLQLVGGENNAFTSNDITNYYITVPADNIETGLWLESDRMLALNFSEESLKIQKNVVIEEYRQRYLNPTYGDIWLLLRPLVYKVHPYRWPTIGEKIEHIQNATLDDVKDFFYSHYAPNNAVIALSGNITTEQAKNLISKWFGDIENRPIKNHIITSEPEQTESRELTVYRNVPFDAIYKSWHIPARIDDDFYVCDVITDLLSSGKSARLYQTLVKEQKLFSEVNAFVSGDVDAGMLIIGGKLMEGVAIEKADKAIEAILDKIKSIPVDERELKKVQNKFEINILQGHTNALNKAMNLAYYEMLGDASILNQQTEMYCKTTSEDILRVANAIFRSSNCSTLNYMAEKNKI